jgi:Chemotaxis phosphatase CheX
MLSAIDHDWNAVLFASAEEVLETMFFCSVHGAIQPDTQVNTLFSTLRFEGVPSGAVTVGVSTLAVREIAANFLGTEAGLLSTAQLEQVTNELANMICGNAMSRTAGGQTVCLTHPEIDPNGAIPKRNNSISANLAIENGYLTCRIEFDPA